MRYVVRSVLGVMLAPLLVSCRGISDLSATTPAAPSVGTVEITPAEFTLEAGASAALQALVRDQSAQPMSGRPLFWSSSDTTVARVSESGLVTAVRIGTAQIAVSTSGRSAVARLTVKPRAVASVRLSPASTSLMVGGTLILAAASLDASGAVLGDRPVVWQSSSPEVATVDMNGVVRGLTAGVVTITATSEDRSAGIGLTVLAVPVSSVTIAPSQQDITVGQSTQLNAVLRDAAGTVMSDRTPTWTSSDDAIATVSSAGDVRGVASGTVTVTATVDGRSGTSTVRVLPRPVSSVIVSPSQSTLTIGESVRLTLQITAADGTLLSGRTATFQSSNESIARVAADGTVTGVMAGIATISATSDARTGTATVTIVASPVASVRVSPASSTISIGTAMRLSATVLDASGVELSQRPVVWTSGAPGVLSVASDGTVIALAAGTALVFATSEGRVGSASITVQASTAASVVVTPTSASIIAGESRDLTAIVRDAGGTLLTGRDIQWTSADNTIAVVSAWGRVRAVAPGITRVSATVDGVTGSMVVTTLPVPIATVHVSVSVSVLTPAQTSQATAEARDAKGNVLLGRAMVWSSSMPGIATVSATGVVTAIAEGSAEIRATSEGVVGRATITVGPVPVASVTVALASSTLQVGGTTQATAELRGASNVILTGRSVAWSSSNASVATVSHSGVVSALAAGSAIITATSEGKSGSASLTVTTPPPAPVASVTVALGASTLQVGGTTQASAELRDAGNVILTGRPVVWSTSNASVASVSASGIVSAIGAGAATITATSEGKSGSASLTVTTPPPAPVASVTVALASSALQVGGSTQASAELRDASNIILTGRSVVWSSSNASIASVSPSGLVTALVAGSVTITATSEGKSGSASLTVNTSAGGPVGSVTVSLASSTLKAGASTQATAIVYNKGKQILTGRVISWTTSNAKVATVSATGVVTGVGVGNATIAATVEEKEGNAKVKVIP